MNIVVYSKEKCPSCMMTKRWLTEHNVSFKAVDAQKDDDANRKLTQLGFMTLPIIEYQDENEVHFIHGFNPSELERFTK